MKALMCTELGGPQLLRLVDVPEPTPAADEVVVRVSYLGLNFHDTLLMAGSHVVRPELPFTPGSEFAGTVVACGEQVTGLTVGDRVVGNREYGCAQEFLTLPARALTVIPDGVSDQLAASIYVTYSTAYHALVQRAQLVAGETLAVLGTASGVGAAAADVGRLLGARVIACASTAERAVQAPAAADAYRVLSYGDAGFKDRLKAATGGRGVDVVFDPVGGDVTDPAFRAIAWNGRYLVAGFAAGAISRLALNLPMVKGAAVVGVFWGDFVRRNPAQQASNSAVLFDWAAAGALRPRIDSIVPLPAAPESWTALAARRVRGKALVAVSPTASTDPQIATGDVA